MTAELDTTATAQRIAESIASLPPLPATAQEILTCFGDEFIDAGQVADVVESDPAICARLLGLSNSSYFGLAEPVASVREAISRVLGVDTVRSLVLAMAIQRSFNSRDCPSFDPERFWMQSLQTAECCKKLAAFDDSADAGVRDLAYSTGLCHNLGLMALAHMEPEVTNAVLSRQNRDSEVPGLRQLFVREISTDHRIMTVELSRFWSLPEPLVNAYHYRAFGNSGEAARLDLIVAAAAATARTVDSENDDDESLETWADKLGVSADDLRSLVTFGPKQLDRIQSLTSNLAR